jgi:alpha-tubulin suppressor-like RCC1 family protein
MMEDTIQQLTKQRALIDEKLSYLTRETFTSFQDDEDEDEDEGEENGDTLTPLPFTNNTNNSSTNANVKKGVHLRSRRGRDQVLHSLSTARNAIVASKSLLRSIATQRRDEFEQSTTSLEYVSVVEHMLKDIQYGKTGEENKQEEEEEQQQKDSKDTRGERRPPLLIPWDWIHSQRGTSCDEDLKKITKVEQIKKDVEREDYVIDGIDVTGRDGLQGVVDQLRRSLMQHAPDMSRKNVSKTVGSILMCTSRTHAVGASFDTVQYIFGCRDDLNKLLIDLNNQTKTCGPISIQFAVKRYLDGWGLGVNITVENCFKICSLAEDGDKDDDVWCKVRTGYIQNHSLESMMGNENDGDDDDDDDDNDDDDDVVDFGFLLAPAPKTVNSSPTRHALIEVSIDELLGEKRGEGDEDEEGDQAEEDEDDEDDEDDEESNEEDDVNVEGGSAGEGDDDDDDDDESTATAAARRSIQRFAGLPLADTAAAAEDGFVKNVSGSGAAAPRHFPKSPIFLPGTTTEEEEEEEDYSEDSLWETDSDASSISDIRHLRREKRKKMALLRLHRQRRNEARMGYLSNVVDPARAVGMSEIHSFGRNKFGMLGTGDTTGRLWPRRINFSGVTELTRVVHVSCSWYHSVALTDVGLMYSWGDGSDGALGHGTNESVLRPRMVEYFTQPDQKEDDRSSSRRSMSSSSSSSAKTSKLPTPVLIIDVACGSDNLGAHTAAVSSKGRIYCWGVGGAIGNNSMQSKNEPVRLGDDTSVSGQKFVRISCGGSFTMAVTKRGSLFSWGKWANGRLGHGPLPRLDNRSQRASDVGTTRTGKGTGRYTHTMFRRQIPRFLLAPQRVARLRGVNIKTVSCGEGHCLATDDRGRCWTWGMASNGQLGIGLTGDQVSPIQIVKWPEIPKKKRIFTKREGRNIGRHHHNSNNTNVHSSYYTGEDGLLPFIGVVACGSRHSCAIDRRGRLYTWGGNGGCMLGIPTDLAVDVSAVRHTSIKGRLRAKQTIIDLSSQSMGSNDPSLIQSGDIMSEVASDGGGEDGGGPSDASRSFDQPWMLPRQVKNLSSGSQSVSSNNQSIGAYHSVVTQVSAGADHTVCITAAGEVYSWGGIVEHVTHATMAASISGDSNNKEKEQMEKLMKKESKKDKRLYANQLLSKQEYTKNMNEREENYVKWVLDKEAEEAPVLQGRSLGVLGDGSVRSFMNSPSLVACRAQMELARYQSQNSGSGSGSGGGGSGSGSGSGGGQSAAPKDAALAQRRATAVACGGWHTLVVTAGTHVGMDLRRPLEPGLGTLRESLFKTTGSIGGMNRGIGHWASDLILLVSDRSLKNTTISFEEEERMNEIINKKDSARSETKAIFAHQVIVRHRSPILAEKIRDEERKQSVSINNSKRRAITILLPDLDFNVALVLLEFMYTDDVFTRLLPGEDLVRNVLSAAEEYGMPRLRSICQAAIEGEGRALQLHPEETDARSRLGMEINLDEEDEINTVEDDTSIIHRVPMPMDSGLASDLYQAIDRPANSDVLFICSSSGEQRPLHAHSVLLMARSTYFEELLFPILGKRGEAEYGQEDPVEIEVPDSRSVMLEVLHYIYTGQVRATPPTEKPTEMKNQKDTTATAVTAMTTREELLIQIEWLMLCIHASHRYEIPRMRLLCESMCEKPLIELCNPAYCLNMLIDLKAKNCNNLFEVKRYDDDDDDFRWW